LFLKKTPWGVFFVAWYNKTIMKKYILALALFSLLVGGSLVLAQDTQTTTNTQTDVDPLGATSTCVSLKSSNLRYKARDVGTNGEVSALQDFLQTKSYLTSEPTGYFGLLTLQAVKSFQSANGITPTGYVGPITRAKISTMTGCTGNETNQTMGDKKGDVPGKGSDDQKKPGEGMMCTMEARQCPDGSYVGRGGPHCEFKKCPGDTTTQEPSHDRPQMMSGMNGEGDKPKLPPPPCGPGAMFNSQTGAKCEVHVNTSTSTTTENH
jgi:hypothetical protein